MGILRKFNYPKDVRLVAYKNQVCKFYLYFDGRFNSGITDSVQNDIEIVITNILLGISSDIQYITTKNIRVKLMKSLWSLDSHKEIKFQINEKKISHSEFMYKLYITFNKQNPSNDYNMQESSCYIQSPGGESEVAQEGKVDIEMVDDIEPKVILHEMLRTTQSGSGHLSQESKSNSENLPQIMESDLTENLPHSVSDSNATTSCLIS